MTSFLFLKGIRLPENIAYQPKSVKQKYMNILLIKNLAAGAIMASVANTSPVTILSSAVSGQSIVQEIVTGRIPDALDAWLTKLVKKESEGREHIKILDHNNQYSYGCLQFQMATFRSYVRRYDLLTNTEDGELENMIYDCDFQKVIARKMIEEDYSNWRNWYTSVTKSKVGYPPRISPELAEK